MKIHNITQGTEEWLAFRAAHFGSSEAAAMMGLSEHTTRTELISLKKYGFSKEFSAWTQKNILDKGHIAEESARPIIEEQLGIDLYPVTCSLDRISASCDGLTLDGSCAWEHKQYNSALFQSVSSALLPHKYMPQCQQILLVTGAAKLYFTVSDGTPARMATLEVMPDQSWFDRLREGWAQFEKDLETYIPAEIIEKPRAHSTEGLTALVCQVEGRIIKSNFEDFGRALTTHLADTRKMIYATDQDFADAEERAIIYRDTCKKLEITKAQVLEQASIGEAFRIIDAWHEDLRVTALQIEKDCKKNKEARQIAIINGGRVAFTAFIAELEAGITPIRINYAVPDFVRAIKGKRLFSAMHDAVQTALANAKIECTKIAGGILHNLTFLGKHDDYKFLFNDLQSIIYKDADDFQLLVSSRIAEHKKLEEKNLEAERQKAIADERTHIDAAVLVTAQKEQVAPAIHTSITESKKQSVASAPTLRLGQIVERLGFNLNADFLRHLGFTHAAKDKAALLYHEHEFDLICDALMQHLSHVQLKYR